MTRILILIALVFLTACETFQGVRVRELSFPDMTPQLIACIENTLKNKNQVTFLKYKKSPAMEGKTLRLVNFTETTHYFYYALEKMNEHKFEFQLYVTESRSADRSRNFNHYSHAFGYIHNSYTDEERRIGKETISQVDGEIKRNCLKDSSL